MHALGGNGMEESCVVCRIDVTVLGNGGDFLCNPKGCSIVGGPSIAVGIVAFYSLVAAWCRESSRRHLIPRKRLVMK